MWQNWWTGIACKNAVVTHLAVVCDVDVCHQEASGAHLGEVFAACSRSAVDGHAFADHSIVAHLHARLLSREFEVLRDAAQDCAGKDRAVVSQFYVIVNGNVGTYAAAVAYFDIAGNVAEGAYLDILADAGVRVYKAVIVHRRQIRGKCWIPGR